MTTGNTLNQAYKFYLATDTSEAVPTCAFWMPLVTVLASVLLSFYLLEQFNYSVKLCLDAKYCKGQKYPQNENKQTQ